MRSTIAVLALLSFAMGLNAALINVPADFEAIQAAIESDATADGDTILLAEGRYIETVTLNSERLTIGSLFLIDGQTRHISRTIIDSDQRGTTVSFIDDRGSSLVGVTVMNGFGECGGGIYCESSSPSIRDCQITTNHAEYGGGLGLIDSDPAVENCDVILNIAAFDGAGFYCRASDPLLDGCSFLQNEASGSGGAIAIDSSSTPAFAGCLIEENACATGQGGGLFITASSQPSFLLCRVMDNESPEAGAGAFIDDSCEVRFDRCVFEDNVTMAPGGQIAAFNGSVVKVVNSLFNWEARNHIAILFSASTGMIVNSILYGQWSPFHLQFDRGADPSHLVIAYSDVENGRDAIETGGAGELVWGEGNIDSPPRYYYDPPALEFHLQANSPCVDAGTSLYIWEDDTIAAIPDEEWEGNAPDIGIYESPYMNSVTQDQSFPGSFILLSAYPNPFNSTTTLTYFLPMASPASLKLYDLSGRVIRTLVDSDQQAGVHWVVLSSADLPAGLYLVRLESAGRSLIQKTTLIR